MLRIDGILLGYEYVRVVGCVENTDFNIAHANIQATFTVFRPCVGAVLRGTVAERKSSSVVVTVQEYFQVVCSLSASSKLDAGDETEIVLTSVAFVNGRPQLLGEVKDGGEKPATAKRKVLADSNKNSKKAKTDKTAPFKASSQEIETVTEKSIDKENHKKTESRVITSSDRPSTSKVKASLKSSGIRKSSSKGGSSKEQSMKRGIKLPLPEGFEVIVKKTVNKTWKEYVDSSSGKMYRSIPQIYRELGLDQENPPSTVLLPLDSNATACKEVLEEIPSNVVSKRKDMDKAMKNLKNKFICEVGLEKLPNSEQYFTQIKSKLSNLGSVVTKEGEMNDSSNDFATPLSSRSNKKRKSKNKSFNVTFDSEVQFSQKETISGDVYDILDDTLETTHEGEAFCHSFK